jgi:hypothetical protein
LLRRLSYGELSQTWQNVGALLAARLRMGRGKRRSYEKIMPTLIVSSIRKEIKNECKQKYR